MLNLPTTIEEIDQLIADQVQESIHLEYKSSQAIEDFDELAKDISAFANSDGGVIIYGVLEKDHLPIGRDTGVDHKKYNRERVENIITSRISPRIDGVLIAQIPLSASTSLYAIKIPNSFRGPHQAPNKKYHKRYNFKAEAMEDYEINDVRNRRKNLPPLVNVDVELDEGLVVQIVVSNIGAVTAKDIEFELSEGLQSWLNQNGPNFFTRGIKHLPPKRTHKLMYESINAALAAESDVPSSFTISVSYLHPEADERVTEIFDIDFEDYRNTLVTQSEIQQHGKQLKESIDKLTSEVKELNKHVKNLSSVTSDTGLDLSITTIRNLKHLVAGSDQIEKINPAGCNYRVFMEVLGVDSSMALRLRSLFWRGNHANGLGEIQGMTEELMEKIKKHFSLKEEKETVTE